MKRWFQRLLGTILLAACAGGEPDVSREPLPHARPLVHAKAAPVLDVAVPAAANSHLQPSVTMPIGFVMLGPGRWLPVELANLETAEVLVLGLHVAELGAVKPLLGVHPPDEEPLSELDPALARRIVRSSVRATDGAIDVFSSVREQFALVALRAEGASTRVALVQRGELSVLLKIGEESGLVWVTSTRTGEPVSGAVVTIQQGKSERFRAHTNEQGLARLPAERRLRIAPVPDAEHEHVNEPLHAIAQKGKAVGLTAESHTSGIEPWHFGLPETYYRGADSLRGSVHSERGIYRPGEHVHLLGVLRQRLSNGKLAPPLGAVALSIKDPDGNEIHAAEPQLTEFGTFRAKIPIERSARLGRYSVVVQKLGMELRTRFEVGEYRPVRFEVRPEMVVTPGAPQIQFPVSAGYLYGSPVERGKLSFTLSYREKQDLGAWAAGFRFNRDACLSYRCDPASSLVELTRVDAELDEAGKIVVPVPRELVENQTGSAQAVDLIVEASVQDAAGDVVTARTSQTWLRARALVGLATEDWVVSPTKGWTVKLLVTDASGAARSGEPVELRLSRRKWVAAAAEHGGRARYQGGWEEEVVSTRSVTSADRALPIRFALPAGGEYRVDARLAGETYGASERVWAYGGDAYGAWDNHARMVLRSDRESYRSGDRARLYAEVPYERALGLVTLEREGVLEARVVRLNGAGTPIEVKLDASRAPNVFASLTVVPAGLGRRSPAAGPPLRIGYRELRVDPQERRLRVEVRPERPRARPGERLPIAVRVTDHQGRPARAEVTLWAADEGVLKLTGYATPDPFVAAYERHSHQVRTAANLLRWVTVASTDHSEYGGDGASGTDSGAAFRSRFLGTAFFSGGIVTDARGRGRLTVPLPDNLTRWRLMASAADDGERFGSGEVSFTTSKPLQVMPALPRFLTQGDALDATVLVRNRTAHAGTVQVKVDVDGAELDAPRSASVWLAAGAERAVRYALRATSVGKARFRASARLRDETDAFEVELPVHAATVWRTALVGEGRLAAPATVGVELPKETGDGLAELIVGVAPGVLASIGSSVDGLIEYPHGCVEQTTSRLIPMVLLEEILRSSGDLRFSGRAHRTKLENAVAHVLKHQNADGGFGLWPSSASEGFLTAYALWGLFTAKDHGYSVPAPALRAGLAYLAQNTNQGEDLHGQFSTGETRPFAAYVLARAKHDDGGLGAELLRGERALSRFGRGLLGAALTTRGARHSGDESFDRWRSALSRTRTGVLVTDTPVSSTTFGYGADLRATAATVHALLLGGNIGDATPLVAGILDSRRGDGSWGTTYNNLWALRALADYAEHEVGALSTGSVRIALGGAAVATLTAAKSTPYRTLTIPWSRLPAPGRRAELSVSAPPGSSLRYTARLRWAPQVGAARPVNAGLEVRRALFDAKTGAPVSSPTRGQLLRVRLEVTSPEERPQVALVDRLPAGFEAVDTALQTEPQADGVPSSSAWVHRELHDERVTHFADRLGAGTHVAEYLVRATRSGTFVRPALSAELMYSPDVFGHGAVETVRVR